MSFLNPTISELADKARSKLRAGEATSIPDAARKAVIGTGITNPSEVRKKAREVAGELGRRGRATQKASADRLREAQKHSERVSG